jgi:5-methylcytosine-specific restriction protein A
MPIAPRRPCSSQPCSGFAAEGTSKCAKHKASTAQTYDRSRGTSSSRGYDSKWRRVRLLALDRDMHVCQMCLKMKPNPIYTPAQHVDHITPFNGKDDPLRLDLDNLQSLCQSCHNRKTILEDKRGWGAAR